MFGVSCVGCTCEQSICVCNNGSFFSSSYTQSRLDPVDLYKVGTARCKEEYDT